MANSYICIRMRIRMSVCVSVSVSMRSRAGVCGPGRAGVGVRACA